MNLMEKIPKGFYKLFASKYMEYYMRFLAAIYEESGRSYSLLGLTEQECRSIMNEWIAVETLDWGEEQFDEEGELLTRSNMAFICLKHLEEWGWLRRDFDESLNSYVVSFPEYGQMFVELFQKLYSEDETKERQSVLAVYSYLYTYGSDKEKNNDILKSALQTSRSLLQMLSNMQEGMRGYFDELSRQKSFLGIQEVLVKEINNSDSKKYAILTTTDSFYRYKEAVKELIDQNLRENEARKREFSEKLGEARREEDALAGERNRPEGQKTIEERVLAGILEPADEVNAARERELARATMKRRKLERAVQLCEEAADFIYRIEREFDAIEKRYNKLIEQKTVFANRAAARIRYILLEGAAEEDRTVALVGLLNKTGDRQEEILHKLAGRMHLTERFRVMGEKSLARRRESSKDEFVPQAVVRAEEEAGGALDGFVLKPLYTGREIAEFRERHVKDGTFSVDADSVETMEDLEKLFFVWQEATENADGGGDISVGGDVENGGGFRFSKLTIEE